MTENDIKYRQGRSKKQVESNYKVMSMGVFGFFIAIISMILYGIISNT